MPPRTGNALGGLAFVGLVSPSSAKVGLQHLCDMRLITTFTFPQVPVRDAQPFRLNEKWKTKKHHRPPIKGDTRNGLSHKLSQYHIISYILLPFLKNI